MCMYIWICLCVCIYTGKYSRLNILLKELKNAQTTTNMLPLKVKKAAKKTFTFYY